LLLFTVSGWAGGKKDTQRQQQTKDSTQSVTPSPQPEPPPPPFFTGDGGKGTSIAILAPQASGLTRDQSYLPVLVQGEFVSNFSSYSAISVLDRQRLDDQYKELLSGYYDDKAEAGQDLGHLTPTTHIMGGTITRTATGYALQMQITITADKMIAASYSGTCTFAELDNLAGIRRASLDLLEKMGITPTARTRTELAGAAATNHVRAQTSLAQGISVQRQGTVVEALTYYKRAASFDTSLLEAASRSSAIFAVINASNIGEIVRSDIQKRNEWLKTLDEASEFFKKNPPFEIVYNPKLSAGKTD
jgi:hypothetical protein